MKFSNIKQQGRHTDLKEYLFLSQSLSSSDLQTLPYLDISSQKLQDSSIKSKDNSSFTPFYQERDQIGRLISENAVNNLDPKSDNLRMKIDRTVSNNDNMQLIQRNHYLFFGRGKSKQKQPQNSLKTEKFIPNPILQNDMSINQNSLQLNNEDIMNINEYQESSQQNIENSLSVPNLNMVSFRKIDNATEQKDSSSKQQINKVGKKFLTNPTHLRQKLYENAPPYYLYKPELVQKHKPIVFISKTKNIQHNDQNLTRNEDSLTKLMCEREQAHKQYSQENKNQRNGKERDMHERQYTRIMTNIEKQVDEDIRLSHGNLLHPYSQFSLKLQDQKQMESYPKLMKDYYKQAMSTIQIIKSRLRL